MEKKYKRVDLLEAIVLGELLAIFGYLLGKAIGGGL